MKKFLLSLGAALIALPGFSATFTTTMQGSGTQTDPYLVSTPAHLVEMQTAGAYTTTSTRVTFDGLYFKMTNDIDMGAITGFLGIGAAPATAASSTSYMFNGVFDGAGFTVKNLKIVGVTFDANGAVQTAGANKSRNYVGLFGYLGAKAKVSNLTLDATCSMSGYNYVAGIAGYAKTGAVMENCVNKANVEGYNNYAAGVCSYGETNTSFTKCDNYGNVVCRNQYSAGIVGYSNYLTTMSNCSNYGTISAWGQYVGGITACAKRTSTQTATKIIRCYNAGTIYGNYSYGGGIVGHSTMAEIRECVNVGDVNMVWINEKRSPDTQASGGGIAGYSDASDINNCLNAGTVTVSKEIVGGLVGEVKSSGDGLIENCINIGAVIAPPGGAKGMLAGFNGSAGGSLAKFSNCYYDAQISAAMCASPCGSGFYSPGFNAMTTAELTSGTPIKGLPASIWKYTAGSYPMLTAFVNDETKTSAAAYFTLPAGITSENFTSGEATINTTVAGLTAKLAVGKYFSISGGKITATKAGEQVLDTVILSNGDITRIIPLQQSGIKFEGEGTQAKPWLITSKQDLIALENFCSNGLINNFFDRYFKLTADIDMQQDTTFHGIGTKKGLSNAYRYITFCGNFDGDNHVIKNLKIDGLANSVNYCGFFGPLGGSAVIQNLNFDTTCYVSGKQDVGTITGFANQGAQIINCTSGATIELTGTLGGGMAGTICGGIPKDDEFSPALIKNCMFYGKFKNCADAVGGMCGQSNGIIEGCVNIGTIELPNYANVTSTSKSKYGGMAGSNYGNIIGCANYGKIAGPVNVGGIAGLTGSTYNGGNFYSCFNAGLVFANDSITDNFKQGTIVGNVGNASTIYECDGVYYDAQLAFQKASIDTVNPEGVTPLLTSQLTNGQKIEDLEGFTFNAGFYPIPTYFANNELVKQAAATFFTLPEDQNLVSGIKRGLINTVMPIKPALSETGVFELSDNRVMAINISTPTRVELTLTCGDFVKVYPILNPGGQSYIYSAEADEVVSTVYYDMQGQRVINPEKGSIVTAISFTKSGKAIVNKIVK